MGIVPASLEKQHQRVGSSLLPKPKFRPDVEGLRGVAILLVVAYHAGIPGFSGGYIGVDVFFVLSGYLITWLLVSEADATGRIDLWGFYARRARRLFPALIVVLVATIGASVVILSPIEQLDLWKTAAATALYVSNIFFARRATDYLASEAETDPLLHTWSLAVEEQFYFAWPLIVMIGLGLILSKSNRPSLLKLTLTLGIVVVLSFALSVWLTSARQAWAFFSSPTRAWEFGVGALAVLLARGEISQGGGPLSGARLRGLLGFGGAFGVALAAFSFSDTTQFPGFAALLPAIATAVVLWSCASDPTRGIGAALSVRPLQEFGRLSYSWYLWHWPVLVLAAALASGDLPLWSRVLLLGLSLSLAEASYRWVENPVRHSKLLSKRPAYSLAMGVAVTLAGFIVALGLRQGATLAIETPAQQSVLEAKGDRPTLGEGCVSGFYDSEVKACTFGDQQSDRIMVLFGDSHAEQWLPAFNMVATENGWRVVSLFKSACPPHDIEFYYGRLGRVYRECTEWREKAFSHIAELQPEVVVTAGSYSYSVSVGDWDKGTSDMAMALRSSGASVIMMRDTPRPGFNVPDCLSRRNWRSNVGLNVSCDFPADREDAMLVWDTEQRVAEELAGVSTLDVHSDMCFDGICPAEIDGTIVYRDTNHITATFAMSMVPILEIRLSPVMRASSQLRATPVTP